MTENKGLFSGGENGIRTHERIAPLHAFQACAFNRSATSPLNKQLISRGKILYIKYDKYIKLN